MQLQEQRAGGLVVEIERLEPQSKVEIVSNAGFLTAALGHSKAIHYKSRDQLATIFPPVAGLPVSKLYVAAEEAFRAHIPLSLSPEVRWYAIDPLPVPRLRGCQEPGRG